MTRRFYADDSMIVAGPALNRVPRPADLARLKSFRIGPVEVRPASREVILGDRREVLEPRVMQVLVVLADARGEILSRDDLIAACWQSRAVTDHSINRVILRLRALARSFPAFEIETVIKVGYRLVEKEAPAGADREAADAGSWPARRWRLLRAGIACAAVAAAIGVWHLIGPPVPGFARAAPAAPAAGQINGNAYALYRQATSLLRQRRQADMAPAEGLLKQAVKLQPGFAPAWADLSIATMLGQFYASGDRTAHASAQNEARRALALDPRLAEGWAASALARELTGDAAEAEIHRALQLQPHDSQILLWASAIEQSQGDYTQACGHARAAAELDPLWVNAAEAGAECLLLAGLPADAYGYADRLQDTDPDSAAFLEARLALDQGDFAKAVAIGLSDPARMARTEGFRGWTARTLMYLGESNAGAALMGMSSTDRDLAKHRLPGPAPLLKWFHQATGSPNQGDWFELVFSEMAAAGRWSEVVRLYDQGLGPFADIRRGVASAQDRMRFASVAALALKWAGREAEARSLQRQADTAADRLRANGLNLPAEIWYELADMDAAQGRRERAVEELQHAYDHPGLGGFTGYPDVLDDPYFASLKGDPRFEQMRNRVLTRLRSERRKVFSLGVL